MKCCDIEPMLMSLRTEIKEDKEVNIAVFECINPNCDNYKKTWEEEISNK